jgi:hypothetical protein
VRVIRGWAAPGASATTFGSWVFVRRGVEPTELLLEHERQHTLQYARLGFIGFLARYIAAYLRWRARGWPHIGAYRRIPYEVQAEWRARVGLGVGVTPPR